MNVRIAIVCAGMVLSLSLPALADEPNAAPATQPTAEEAAAMEVYLEVFGATEAGDFEAARPHVSYGGSSEEILEAVFHVIHTHMAFHQAMDDAYGRAVAKQRGAAWYTPNSNEDIRQNAYPEQTPTGVDIRMPDQDRPLATMIETSDGWKMQAGAYGDESPAMLLNLRVTTEAIEDTLPMVGGEGVTPEDIQQHYNQAGARIMRRYTEENATTQPSGDSE